MNFRILLTCFLFCFFQMLQSQVIEPGSWQIPEYLNVLKGKKVGLVANHTSVVKDAHLLDTLLSLKIDVFRVFAPEHGFRGETEAGERVKNEVDAKTGIKVVSLYGRHYKPTKQDMEKLDVVVFDIQDVGVRCYTYLSTLHYVMEACARYNKQLIVLDRPNPNSFYVDGPVLELKYKSFVGLHPVPLVYGMTIGEYAMMINGEGWLPEGLKCQLTVVPCKNYIHADKYVLPIKPSPNLPNMQAIYLYPSLVLFEGTCFNVGRGTDFPFQTYGHPQFEMKKFSYTPHCMKGTMTLHCDTLCYGEDLRNISCNGFSFGYVINAYNRYSNKQAFFNRFFANLIGNTWVKEQVVNGKDLSEIQKMWKKDLDFFKDSVRVKYLIYK